MPVVKITLFEGRDDCKQAVAKDVTDSLVKHANIDPKYIYVIFEDVPTKNFAISGEIFAETLKKQQ